MHAIIESGGVGWRAHGLASPSWPQGRERRTSMSKAALIRADHRDRGADRVGAHPLQWAGEDLLPDDRPRLRGVRRSLGVQPRRSGDVGCLADGGSDQRLRPQSRTGLAGRALHLVAPSEREARPARRAARDDHCRRWDATTADAYAVRWGAAVARRRNFALFGLCVDGARGSRDAAGRWRGRW